MRKRVENFDLSKTLSSGQFFCFEKIKDIYILNLSGEKVKLCQRGDYLYFDKSETFFEEKIVPFFDLDYDYSKKENEIIDKFPELKDIVLFSKGLHFMNQDLLMVCSFAIISQNNNMKRIGYSLNKMIEDYGENGNFPSLEKLKTLGTLQFKALGVGFRDKYLYEFFRKVDEPYLESLKKMTSDEAFLELTSFKGIGPKVANCIIIFGLQKRDAFPVDTHIKKIMQNLYFNDENVSEKKIEAFAKEKFKESASFVQQCLFFYKINH